jgi:hypothetical protein
MAPDPYRLYWDWKTYPVSITIDPTRENVRLADLIIAKWDRYRRRVLRDLKRRLFR